MNTKFIHTYINLILADIYMENIYKR